MIKKIKFGFKTIYIIIAEGIKYLCKGKKRNYSKFIINVSNRLSKENIFYLKLLQGLSNNIYNLNPELEEYFEKYADNVEFSEEDIDKDALNCILNLSNTTSEFKPTSISEINNDDNKNLIVDNSSNYKETIKDDDVKLEERLIIDTTPIKSGIISIVFKGTIGDKKVIVKIKRKNILNKLNEGLNNMEFIIKFFNYIPKIKHLNLYNVFKENKELLIEQTNFLNEVNNIKLFNDKFKKIDYIVIPNVYDTYTRLNENIIVMDYIEGDHINRIKTEHKDEYALKFSKFGLKCILFDGIFHGDLHPGNILFMRENNILKLGIIDYGIIGKLDDYVKEHFLSFFSNIFEKDFINASKNLLEFLTEPKNHFNDLNEKIKENIINDISKIINEGMIIHKTLRPKDVIQINVILNKYKLQLSKIFCKIEMSLAIAESLTQSLTTDKSYMEYFDVALEEILVG